MCDEMSLVACRVLYQDRKISELPRQLLCSAKPMVLLALNQTSTSLYLSLAPDVLGGSVLAWTFGMLK